jgi:hypothetical protein
MRGMGAIEHVQYVRAQFTWFGSLL